MNLTRKAAIARDLNRQHQVDRVLQKKTGRAGNIPTRPVDVEPTLALVRVAEAELELPRQSIVHERPEDQIGAASPTVTTRLIEVGIIGHVDEVNIGLQRVRIRHFQRIASTPVDLEVLRPNATVTATCIINRVGISSASRIGPGRQPLVVRGAVPVRVRSAVNQRETPSAPNPHDAADPQTTGARNRNREVGHEVMPAVEVRRSPVVGQIQISGNLGIHGLGVTLASVASGIP